MVDKGLSFDLSVENFYYGNYRNTIRNNEINHAGNDVNLEIIEYKLFAL